MPQPFLQETDNMCILSKKPSRAWSYGIEYLIDSSSSDLPELSVWNPINLKPQQYLNALTQRATFSLQSQKGLFPVQFVGTYYDTQGLLEVFSSHCIGKYNPFTQVDLIDNEVNQLVDLLFRFKTSPLMSIPFRERMVNRLVVLMQDAQEEDNAILGITVGSLRSFYNFIHLHKGLKFPDISLTPDNNIYATWKSQNNRIFSLHFLPTGDARFVILKPNDRHPEKQIRTTGTSTVDIIMDLLKPFGLEEWVTE